MPNDYQIGSGFSEQELNAASWWVRHGLGLRRATYTGLIALNAILWGYSVWGILDAYVISRPREARIPSIIARDQLSLQTIRATTPQPLQPSEVAIFESTDHRVDFLINLNNPNPQWWATFDYRFDTRDATSSTVQKGYILPSSSRYLTDLGRKTTGGAPEFKIENLEWHRIDPAKVDRDYQAFAAQRMQLAIDKVDYKNDLTLGSQTIGQTSFELINPSGYGFWSVDLTIVLHRNDVPVAVTVINQKELKPGEHRPITVNWLDNLGGINKTEVQPNVNILDPQAFLPTTRF